MHKSLVALVGAAGIGVAALAAPGTANAQCFGCAVGAGVLGAAVTAAPLLIPGVRALDGAPVLEPVPA